MLEELISYVKLNAFEGLHPFIFKLTVTVMTHVVSECYKEQMRARVACVVSEDPFSKMNIYKKYYYEYYKRSSLTSKPTCLLALFWRANEKLISSPYLYTTYSQQ